MGTDKYLTFIESLRLSDKFKMSDKKSEKKSEKKTEKIENNSDLGALEEDDDFEEFPVEDWKEDSEVQEDIHAWEDDWDDDNVEDDFSQQLRTELEKQGHKKK